jgi:hypothetical protein
VRASRNAGKVAQWQNVAGVAADERAIATERVDEPPADRRIRCDAGTGVELRIGMHTRVRFEERFERGARILVAAQLSTRMMSFKLSG